MPAYNLALIFVVMAACVGVLVTALALVFSMAPGWREERLLALIGGSAALFSIFDVVTYLPNVSMPMRVTLGDLSIAVGAAYIAGWIVYSAKQRASPLSALDRSLLLVLGALATSGLVPGAAYSTREEVRNVAWLGMRYYDPAPTAWGEIAFLLFSAVLVTTFVRMVLDYRRGLPRARLSAWVLGVITVGATNDMLATSGVYGGPNLLGISFVITLGLLGLSITRRFVGSATLLESLKCELESRVEERTQKLAEAQAALVRVERLGALGQLSAGVAHEINNPLSAILGNLQFLRRTLGKRQDFPELSGALDDSMVAIERIKRIVRRLLDASRAAAHDPVTNAACRAAAAVRGAVRVAESLREPHVTIETDVSETLCVRGERYMLEQVLTNLLINAYQATPEARKAGRVRISAEPSDDRVIISVSDDGVGMSAETRSRLFEPFFTTKPLGKGTGLGLAVSAGLVQAMGGTLAVESSEGKGTEVQISLLHAAEPNDELASEAAMPPLRQRLLFVDDDDVVRRATQRTLSRAFDVVLANGVQQALDTLAVDAVDVIVCDVMMPDGGGEALYEKLRCLRPNLAQRMLFLTGGVSASHARDFLAQQPQPVLTKPLELARLLRAVAELGPPPGARVRSEPPQVQVSLGSSN
ncbi:MAG TPA: ATP-binding protein [Polyangiaceae bacterium]|jgi:signal transduction histidine kinase/ActR/RegA family two-component response regulator|nr:ATP-binding protein [Polyangiaceae bacterium]